MRANLTAARTARAAVESFASRDTRPQHPSVLSTASGEAGVDCCSFETSRASGLRVQKDHTQLFSHGTLSHAMNGGDGHFWAARKNSARRNLGLNSGLDRIGNTPFFMKSFFRLTRLPRSSTPSTTFPPNASSATSASAGPGVRKGNEWTTRAPQLTFTSEGTRTHARTHTPQRPTDRPNRTYRTQ